MKPYRPTEIEAKWQQLWDQTQLYRVTEDEARQKYYYLVEFPYPSGDGLHVGHVRSYTALDIMARHKRMQGYNVLYPMGFDAFGLPTENYAIKHKIAPQQATAENVATFTRQLKSLGLSFDWARAVNTTDPNFYKWTQWIFLRLFERGLAYQAEMPINWCPFEKTGLANEEVVNGVHERCGTPVEKKLLKQWMLKITAYADRLLDDLETVDYSERIKAQQINWIGRSEGAEIEFALKGASSHSSQVRVYTTRPDTIYGATFLVVSPELVRSWQEKGWEAPTAVDAYVSGALNEQELTRQERADKTGVATGLAAIHPLTNEELPVWVADYVLGSYGTGAIMAVPAHDQRDNDFARAFNLPIKAVVAQDFGEPLPDCKDVEGSVVIGYDRVTKQFLGLRNHNGELGWLISGGREDGETFADTARRELAEEAGYHNLKDLIQLGPPVYSYYYNDNKKSNRRSLGYNYLAIIDHDEHGETHHEAHEQFSPLWAHFDDLYRDIEATKGGVEHWMDALRKAKAAVSVIESGHSYRPPIYSGYGPLVESDEFSGLAGDEAKRAIVSKLIKLGAGRAVTRYKLRDWIFSRQHYWGEPIPVVHCLKDGVVPVPDDQLPVTLPEVDHYEPTETGESPLAAITDWVETTCPTCDGPARRETDTMPNWAGSSWYFLRYADPHNAERFAARDKLDYWTPVDLYNGGMEHTTLHLLYSRFWHKFLYDQGLVPTAEPYLRRRSHGMVLGPDGRKMSKSVGNVINPDHVVKRYGADTLRLYEMFMGPFEDTTSWSEERLNGVSKFVYRVWTLAHDLIAAGRTGAATAADGDLGVFVTETDRILNKTLKKVHEDIEGMHFNTAVSALMELLNYLTKAETKARLLQGDARDLRERTLRLLLLMLAPLTPHLAEELWGELGEEGSIHRAAWPAHDPALIKDDVIEIAVQVNGKLRGTVMAGADADEKTVVAIAKTEPKVATYLKDHEIIKTINVPRKLVNFVIR